ncbi:MAG: hypothetical protein CME18_00580 [Gemmatimonadetes bacterium]|nr:hypothetical protein [Gemmatimonadota bacterium]
MEKIHRPAGNLERRFHHLFSLVLGFSFFETSDLSVYLGGINHLALVDVRQCREGAFLVALGSAAALYWAQLAFNNES